MWGKGIHFETHNFGSENSCRYFVVKIHVICFLIYPKIDFDFISIEHGISL
jgi:hypothetical protein